MIYNADDLRNWTTDAHIDGKWVAARPMQYGTWDRIKTAWLVLLGKCDGVRWYKQ